MACQICKNPELKNILDMGKHPPPLNFLSAKDSQKHELFPLQLFHCSKCGLVQLGDAVDPKKLFKKYAYTSGVSVSFKNHLFSLAELLVKKFELTSNELVIDIGSNDGTLLQGFTKFNVKVLGIEPSNVAKIAVKNGIPTINDFFDERVSNQILKEYGQAKIITAANIFAHVKKLDSFMKGIKLLLKEDGVYVSESQYLQDIIEKLEFDTIYHEHLRYYGLKQITFLLKLFDMEVFHAERISAQGGSIRVYSCHKGKFPISESVQKILDEEEKLKISHFETLQSFAKRVQKNKKELNSLLLELKKEGKKIAGIGAPARSCTILNYCEIGPDILDFITEKSTLKIGKVTPGSNIKVVDDDELIKIQPDYALLLSWHFKDLLIPKMKQAGYKGKFIIPLPKVEVI